MQSKIKSVFIQKIMLSIFMLFIGVLQCCNNETSKINLVFNDFEKYCDSNFLKEFKGIPEENVLDVYFSYFLYEYGDWVNKNLIFSQTLNLEEEPEKVYAFLLLWHRKLNKKESNISEAIAKAKDGNIGAKNCLNIKKANSVFNFKRIYKKENIQLKFPVRQSDNFNSTVYYGCPTVDWNFDASKDLIIDGEVIDKYFKGQPVEFYIQLKIIDISREDVLFFFKPIQKNDTIEVNLVSYGLKI